MLKVKLTIRRGFSLVELMVTIMTAIIVVLAVGVVLVDSQRGWNIMYRHMYSDVATDSYVAGKEFDAVMRRAVGDSIILDDAGHWVEVRYYSHGGSSTVDCYVRFYKSGSSLNVEYGRLYDGGDVKEELSVHTLCRNVSDCVFKRLGKSVQMILTLDDGTRTNTVILSAALNN
jgi:hypothetical protein